MGTLVIEVTEFNFEVSLNLRGFLEATMASEATNMAVRGNMHMNIRVFEVSDFNFVVKNDIRHQLRLGPQAPLRNGTEKPD